MFKEYAPWIIGGLVLGLGGWYGIRIRTSAHCRQPRSSSR
jgi:hypothetical protein